MRIKVAFGKYYNSLFSSITHTKEVRQNVIIMMHMGKSRLGSYVQSFSLTLDSSPGDRQFTLLTSNTPK